MREGASPGPRSGAGRAFYSVRKDKPGRGRRRRPINNGVYHVYTREHDLICSEIVAGPLLGEGYAPTAKGKRESLQNRFVLRLPVCLSVKTPVKL
ncbi:hypothetical protein EVAR_64251_1 [Eumeta japonica]|uniref:Uncharacterized protein n=1 Tax=Eumeta variegata TaxID=151549 RepID=A0A4C1YWI1_EUMVA|nr:hypothetical protein EVAR_64251_1 [Eumeta japonica]